MVLPATLRPPKDVKELNWQRENLNAIKKNGSSQGLSLETGTKDGAPRTIILPFYPGGSDKVSRYVEVRTDAEYGATMAQLRVKRTKPIIPGWLIELKDEYLRGVMDIKSILEESKPDEYRLEGTIASICQVINADMNLPVTEIQIYEVLKKIPNNCEGTFSFPHFMYAIANHELARTKGIFMLNERNFPKNIQKRYGKLGPCNCNGSDKSDRSGGDQKYPDDEDAEVGESDERSKNCVNAYDTENNKVDATGYSTREKVFFSGLLIFEMFDTLKQVETLYNLPKIPESAEKEMKRNRKRGFGIENIGSKKFKEVAWDKPLPPVPKISPYLSSVPFVTTRWNVTQPADPNLRLRRTTSRLQPLHLCICPPRKQNQLICITENQTRVRRALEYLAAKGDCVALLPDVHFVIHLSDTAVDKLEVITTRQPQGGETLDGYKRYHSEDERAIMQNVRKLYRPYRLPCQITQLSNLISYADGLQLREICNHLQKQHWNCLSQLKLDFREFVWSRMHVNQIPLGSLRDSFIYAFVTYLPFVSHLPVVHTNPLAL
ncbi:unnamed protein product [Allacma fusca]|uniref:Uncharacterized protein n=1 Tax=Allacma fusca TaxID=39272 RepID=A0A8J2J9C3_9HEXA|nr:unnamed protein product [Allacma fusca]